MDILWKREDYHFWWTYPFQGNFTNFGVELSLLRHKFLMLYIFSSRNMCKCIWHGMVCLYILEDILAPFKGHGPQKMLEKLKNCAWAHSPFVSHDNHHRHFAFILGDRHKNDCMVVLRKRTRPQRAVSAARWNALHWDTDGASKQQAAHCREAVDCCRRLEQRARRFSWMKRRPLPVQGLGCMPRDSTLPRLREMAQ